MFLFLISYVKNEYDPLYSCAHSTEVFTDLPLTLLLVLQSQVLLKMYFGRQMSLPAFAGSLLEVGSDVEKGKLTKCSFFLRLISVLLAQGKEIQGESIIDRFGSKLFTKVALCSVSEACQTEAVVSERFWVLDASMWKQFLFRQVEKNHHSIIPHLLICPVGTPSFIKLSNPALFFLRLDCFVLKIFDKYEIYQNPSESRRMTFFSSWRSARTLSALPYS